MKSSKQHVLPSFGVAIALAVATLVDISRAGLIRHDRSPDVYRQLGADTAFQCVGEVRVNRGQNKPPKQASCVLIAPRWAVTAAHVVRGDYALDEFNCVFAGQTHQVARIIIHRHADGADSTSAIGQRKPAPPIDIALIELATPVENVRPAARYHGDGEVGTEMVKVGHGLIGDGLKGVQKPFVQERRGGHNVIDAAGGKFGVLNLPDHILLTDFDSPSKPELNRLGSEIPLEFEIGFSDGDSGGGWFMPDDRDGGRWKLVAISSSLVPHDGNYSDQTSSSGAYGIIGSGVRISSLNSWIDQQIGTRPE